MSPVAVELPAWGTREALRMGVAHPDWPFHTERSRAEYQWPTGRWWRRIYGDAVPTLAELVDPYPTTSRKRLTAGVITGYEI